MFVHFRFPDIVSIFTDLLLDDLVYAQQSSVSDSIRVSLITYQTPEVFYLS